MTMASATGILSKDLEDFIDTQKADSVLTKFRELSGLDLTRRGLQVSPRVTQYKAVDGDQLIMVPHEL